MTEVSSRTTRTDAVQSVATQATQMFDVRSWQGLTQLLKAGKESGMDTDAYADFRDLVLSYAQSGGTDTALREKIESMATSFNVMSASPVSSEVASKRIDVVQEPIEKNSHKESGDTSKKSSQETESRIVQPRHLGVSRPRPDFTPVVSAAKKESVPVASVIRQQPEASSVNVVPDNLPVSASPSAAVDASLVDPVSQKEEVHVTTSSSTSPVHETTSPVPAPMLKAEDVSAPTSSSVDVPQKSIEEYKDRIAEIKRIVNAKVGNPVMLVGKGNTIGTTYMAALLTAMKAANQGAAGALQTAMQDLEAAFEKVMQLSPEANHISTTPLPETPSESIKKEEHSVWSGEKEAAVLRSAQMTPEVVSAQPDPQPEVARSQSRLESEVDTEVSVGQKPAETPSFPTIPEKHSSPRSEHTIPSLAEVKSAPVPDTLSPVPHVAQSEAVQERASDAPSPTPTSTGIPAKVAVADLAVSGAADHVLPDELKAPAITQGLEQLLSEWELFRSSGILGMGTSGSEHPLYKKLAPLSMSIIASGDWEGAKKEEVFSVRDYLNGWMQEQSIAYLPEESFEHYLRRVVRKILQRKEGS